MPYASKRDANERNLILELQARGWYVQQMDRRAGFDLLLVKAREIRFVEVKDGSKPLSRQKLTAAEIEFHRAMRAHGVKVELLTKLADLQVLERDRGDFYATERNR